MKLKLFLSTIFFVPLFVYSQNIPKDKATIRVHYLFTQRENAEEKPFRSDTMTLDIGSQVSYYYDETRDLKDSIFNSIFSMDKIKSFTFFRNKEGALDNYIGEKYVIKSFDGTKEKIYKNRTNGESVILYNHEKENYRCNDLVGILKWEFTSDAASVLNYECQKAKVRFRGRDYEAWFAPEIPVNDGPWKFMGLPGLIMKVNDTKGLIAFECIGLQNFETQSAIEIPDKKYLKCSRKELEKLKKQESISWIYGINGGDMVASQQESSQSFQFLELE